MFMNETEFMKNFNTRESENNIILASPSIIVPESKIILLDEANQQEINILQKIGF